ncbi:MAG: cysteine--tRNA ligase [Myxococcales bacterium]|nr:cysteine--tRNA ligase [Myxococcales bacterium]
MALVLYNSLTRQKETFEPIDPPRVRVYVCGVTVYDFSHIGHARAYIAFDVIVRYLRFSGFDVTYVRNFTDVDDKIIRRANEQGISCRELSERFIAAYHEDMQALKVLRADVEPRVTDHIEPIVTLIDKILERGHAYRVDGDVQFSIDSFPPYGGLAKREMSQMQAGASERVEVDERLRNPFDFVLWKSGKPGEPQWQSPWGPGRPGWHIECSAMSMCHLGETFDIHGGGKDLIFPHHENELAQSTAATGEPYVKYWLHNGFVNIDNEKMSKSLGNFFTIRDVIELFHPEVVRYFLMTTHYRKPINYSDANLLAATRRVDWVYELLLRARRYVTKHRADQPSEANPDSSVLREFREAMDDDFNAAKALGNLAPVFDRLSALVEDKSGKPKDEVRQLLADLRPIFETLAIFDREPDAFLAESAETRRRWSLHKLGELGITASEIEDMIAQRAAARKERNWARADAIRDELAERGIEMMDSPGGTTWRVASTHLPAE